MAEKTTRPVEILLVEDTPGDVRLFRELLEEISTSTNLHVVEYGEDALAFLRRCGPWARVPCPDVIFLDLYLPRMDGIEILAELKHDPLLREIPVAVFIGTEWEKKRFAAIGQVIAYLTKSFEQEISRLETLLRQIQRRAER